MTNLAVVPRDDYRTLGRVLVLATSLGRGTRIPTPDVLALPAISVATADGVSHEGRPFGVCWAGPLDQRRRYLLISVLKRTNEVLAAISEDSIVEVALDPSVEARANAIAGDTGLLRSVQALGDEQTPGVVARHAFPGLDGGTISVTITTYPHICLPGPDPYAVATASPA